MSAAVDVCDLRYRYADGTPALHGVSFRVEPGECLAVLGPNGSGKSTLLLHLNGLLPEDGRGSGGSGNVTIDGLTVGVGDLHAIRQRVGLLFQDPDDQLFCPTVFEDVAFGPQQFGLADGDLSQRVTEALAQVGLSGFEQRSPHRLSLGQKRRVCLAGVLACRPGVLVLDEPTAGLDPRGRREVQALLRQIPCTKLIATHDLEAAVELCPRALVLDAGLIVAQGPTDELLANEALMLAHGLERPHILSHRHPHGSSGPQSGPAVP